jgi:hypothetical protein
MNFWSHIAGKQESTYMTFKLENENAGRNTLIKARIYLSRVASVLPHIENDTVVMDNYLIPYSFLS